jgi:hypothetical protein
MIRVFYGDDRVGISKAVERVLGEGYEVVEGSEIGAMDMANVFFGGNLFSEKRRIVVKDLSEGAGWGELSKYLGTPHEIILWETGVDKRTILWKELVKAGVEAREFKTAEPVERKVVFDILDTALSGQGKQAVGMVEQIEATNEPYMFVGLLISQVLRKMEMRAGEKEKRVLAELSKLDINMKTTSTEPWLLVKAFLVRISGL